ncbi:hypothetical protein GIB67_037245 [Kingdonia uniflora]|uniref:Secreted protein n=1 Tax=Kingdonia uniflora TaxID=39325 RepID=A0A7J7MS95_9MAGN|nr:hypothetical protein GIB67_037245 [Kingdonia uniflora]
MGNLDLFRLSALIAGITPAVVTSASVHSLPQDFSLPGEAEGPDLGVCSGRTEDPGGGGRACYCPQATLHQLYAHDLQLRRGRDVRVVPLPPGGDTRTRQRGSGPRTRGGSTSRRGRGTGDDSE